MWSLDGLLEVLANTKRRTYKNRKVINEVSCFVGNPVYHCIPPRIVKIKDIQTPIPLYTTKNCINKGYTDTYTTGYHQELFN